MKLFFYVILFINVLAVILYGMDKQRAKRRKERIPEAVLLGIGFFGGALGALFGMYVFRHKTQHRCFWLCNAAGLVWQALFVILGIRNGFFSI